MVAPSRPPSPVPVPVRPASIVPLAWTAAERAWLAPDAGAAKVGPPLPTDLYSISNARGKVGTLGIFKTVYKIGEDVVGTFSFCEGDIPCLQVSQSAPGAGSP